MQVLGKKGVVFCGMMNVAHPGIYQDTFSREICLKSETFLAR